MADGFSEKSLRFLQNVEQHNSREWYAQNKSLYQAHVLNPFKRLVADLSATMLKIDVNIETTPAVDKTISRIYRDTRFSHDKSLYRGNVWLFFKRHEKNTHHFPVFFFEMYPTFYRYGLGFYQTSAKYMALYRQNITNHEKAFLKIITDIHKKSIFMLDGDSYKKNRYPGRNLQVGQWYNRKDIVVLANRNDISEIYNFSALKQRLRAGFSSLNSLYQFLLKTRTMLDE